MKNWTRRRAFALTIIATMYGCDGSEPEETGEEAEAEVELTDRVAIAPEALASLNLTYARAERVELAPSLEVPAELMPAPDRVASVGSRVAGRVVSVAVNTGDRVTQDQPLVTMESAEAGSAWADLMAARARESAAGQAMERQQRLHDSRVTSARAFEEAAAAFEVASRATGRPDPPCDVRGRCHGRPPGRPGEAHARQPDRWHSHGPLDTPRRLGRAVEHDPRGRGPQSALAESGRVRAGDALRRCRAASPGRSACTARECL
jgi:hypothetical protein